MKLNNANRDTSAWQVAERIQELLGLDLLTERLGADTLFLVEHSNDYEFAGGIMFHFQDYICFIVQDRKRNYIVGIYHDRAYYDEGADAELLFSKADIPPHYLRPTLSEAYASLSRQ